ncbi:hypothetical protein J8J40_29890, partial [Mycobacterium tuberculosis]|nr:hypothetical protein [Mycobacterium tuberculosis]
MSSISQVGPQEKRVALLFGSLSKLLPGLLLCGGVAATAYVLRLLPWLSSLSPMILAIVIGIAWR